MRRSRKPIRIAARKSHLAQAQTRWVGEILARLHKGLAVEYQWVTSDGDLPAGAGGARKLGSGGPGSSGVWSMRTPAQGLKGMFTSAIGRYVLDKRSDVAVHSLKDLPTEQTPGLRLAAVPVRADPRDCLIARDGIARLEDLPGNATVGTSSPRRAAQVRRLRPDVKIVPLRGNIETRLKKVLEERACDATLLAVAGLVRGGLGEHAKHPIDPDVILPAAGQGALAIECGFDDHATLIRCLPINDAVSAAAVHAERQVVSALDGDCHSPIAVYAQPAEVEGEAGYRLRARVLSADGSTCLEADDADTVKGARKLVQRVIARLQDQGADRVLRQARTGR